MTSFVIMTLDCRNDMIDHACQNDREDVMMTMMMSL
jgi:hypothetical protein